MSESLEAQVDRINKTPFQMACLRQLKRLGYGVKGQPLPAMVYSLLLASDQAIKVQPAPEIWEFLTELEQNPQQVERVISPARIDLTEWLDLDPEEAAAQALQMVADHQMYAADDPEGYYETED